MSSVSRADLEGYAQVIGISLPREEFLMPLATEGISAPLPRGWEMHETDNGKPYFHNEATNTTTWDHPCDERYKRLVVEQRKRVTACCRDIGAKGTSDARLLALAAELAFSKLPAGYVAHKDDDGNTYYEVQADSTTTWKHPNAAAFAARAQQVMAETNGGGSAMSVSEPLSPSPPSSTTQQPTTTATTTRVVPAVMQPRELSKSVAPSAAAASSAYSQNNNLVRGGDLISPGSPGTEMQTARATTMSNNNHSSTTNTNSPSPMTKRGQRGPALDEIRVEFHPILGPPSKPDVHYDHLTTNKDYDSEWGPPFQPGFHEKPEIKEKQKFDDFFGAPVAPGKWKKPEGKPKTATSSSNRRQPQQQHMMMHHQHQHQQQQANYMQQQQQHQQQYQHQQQQPAAAAAVAPSAQPVTTAAAAAAPYAAATAQQQQQQQQQPQQQQQHQQQQQQQQVFAFAQFLGVNPQTEPHLLGIVAQSLATPPPEPWAAALDPATRRVYYGNKQTKQTVWEHPLKPQFLEALERARQQHKQQQQEQQQQPTNSDAPTRSPAGPAVGPDLQQPREQQQQQSALDKLDADQRQRVIQYGEYLGVSDVSKELYLVEILVEGVDAALPEGWEEHVNDQDGKTYYYNTQTQQSVWEHPGDAVYKQKIVQARQQQQRGDGGQQQAVQSRPMM